MSEPGIQPRQRPRQPCQQLQPKTPQQPNLIRAEATQLSKHMIERHRNMTAAACRSLQTRALELRGSNSELKRSASEFIRETGKRIRRDVQTMVDGVYASTKACEQRACSKNITQIWKRNSILTEENAMLTTRLSHVEEQTQLCTERFCANARVQIVELKQAREQVLADLQDFKTTFRSTFERIQAGVIAAEAGCSTNNAAVQTEMESDCTREDKSVQTVLLQVDDTSTQTEQSNTSRSGGAHVGQTAAVGDFVVQAGAGRGPIVGRVMHILPGNLVDEVSGSQTENRSHYAFVQLYERTCWRKTPSSTHAASPAAVSSPSGVEYWQHAINQSQIVPLWSLQVISMKRGLFGHVVTSLHQ